MRTTQKIKQISWFRACKTLSNDGTITSKMTAADVVFNDPNTRFLAEAGKRGAKAINGLGMLVNQGALNFELWTGVKPPVDVMVRTLKEEFNL